MANESGRFQSNSSDDKSSSANKNQNPQNSQNPKNSQNAENAENAENSENTKNSQNTGNTQNVSGTQTTQGNAASSTGATGRSQSNLGSQTSGNAASGDSVSGRTAAWGGNLNTEINTSQITSQLKDVKFPCSKDQLLKSANSHGLGDNVMAALNNLPNQTFNSPNDVVNAIGNTEL
jgi:hypothetical protein